RRFFFSSRRRHTRFSRDWSSDVCSSDLQNLIKLNNDEEKRLDFEFTREDTGQIYGDVNHPYASDLDLFGKHSLYRLLNRTQTSQGAARLADWLARPAPLEVLLERQKALQESKGNHADR